jgi:hypothetical protein
VARAALGRRTVIGSVALDREAVLLLLARAEEEADARALLFALPAVDLGGVRGGVWVGRG